MSKYLCQASLSAVGLSLALAGLSPAFAQGTNPEDDPIPDEPVPTAPVPVAPAPVAPAPTPTPVPQVVAPPTAPAAAGDTVTVPRDVWEQLLHDVEELKKARAAADAAPVVPAPVAPAPVEAAPEAAGTSTSAPGSRNYLLLPDISYILSSQYLASSDKRDENRRNLDLEGEIGIQGYVFPNVKADSFITANPGQGEGFGIEEGYLTFLGARKNLNIQIGRKFAPFGRTGELHTHSWLYSRQFLPRQNLVAPEALAGNGINFNYLLPTGKNFFARLSLGAFSNGEEADGRFNSTDPTDPFEGGAVTRPGAGFSRFYNGRLWTGTSIGSSNEVELGFSNARGAASIDNLTGVNAVGEDVVTRANGRVNLTGVDFSFRHFLGADKRLLLRSELFKYQPHSLPTSSSTGYYALANYRFSKFKDLGLLYENTEFPTAPGDKEKALSLIYTKQFSERFYARFTGTRGDRPGDGNYNEFRVQFVAGIGPHTHELE